MGEKVFDAKSEDAMVQKVFDGFDNFVARTGLNNNNVLSAGTYTFNLMTRNRVQLEAAYRGSWVVGQVVEVVAEDMTKAGVEVTTNEQEEDIKDLQSAIVKKKVQTSFASMIRWGRLYGGALGVLQIKGQDLSTPLNLDSIGKDQFQGVAVFDRWQLNPILTRVIQDGPDIGLPQFYQIVTTATSTEADAQADKSSGSVNGMILVHHSRVIRYIGIELPFWQAITEMMWGESVLERLWDRLISFDSATMSSANLIERANNRTISIENLREILSAGGKAQAGLEAQFAMMRQFQTNEGLTLIDKNDTFAATSYNFSGLDSLLLQFGQQLAGATGIPLVRLFGQAPAGLNSTGDSDLRTYYDNINSQQESRLRNAWDLVIRVMWRSTFGKPEPKDLGFEFVPLWQMSDLDKATIGKTTTDSITEAYETGLIDRSTAMKELRQSSAETGLFTNITDEAIAEAEKEPDNPPGAEEILNQPEELKPEEEKPKPKGSAYDRMMSWIRSSE